MNRHIQSHQETLEELRNPGRMINQVLDSPINLLSLWSLQRLSVSIDTVPNLWYNILCKFQYPLQVIDSLKNMVHRDGLTAGEILIEYMLAQEDLTIEEMLEAFEVNNLHEAKKELEDIQGDAIYFSDLEFHQSHRLSKCLMDEYDFRLIEGWRDLLRGLGLQRYVSYLERYPYTYGKAVLDHLNTDERTIRELRENILDMISDLATNSNVPAVLESLDREVRILARNDTTSPIVLPEHQTQMQRTLRIYFSLNVVKEYYWFWLIPRTQSKLTIEDCDLDSQLALRIIDAIHNEFEDKIEDYCPQFRNEICRVRIQEPVLVSQGNYLSCELRIDNSDGRPVPEVYHHWDSRESLKLWQELKKVIIKAALFDEFETKVALKAWRIGSIIMIICVTKNVPTLWTQEEADLLVKRAVDGMRQMKLAPPLQFVSLTQDNFMMVQIDALSSNKDFVEAVDTFSHSFEVSLIKRSSNGDPNFTTAALSGQTALPTCLELSNIEDSKEFEQHEDKEHMPEHTLDSNFASSSENTDADGESASVLMCLLMSPSLDVSPIPSIPPTLETAPTLEKGTKMLDIREKRTTRYCKPPEKALASSQPNMSTSSLSLVAKQTREICQKNGKEESLKTLEKHEQYQENKDIQPLYWTPEQKDIFDNFRHALVIGGTGVGKSTIIMKKCIDIVQKNASEKILLIVANIHEHESVLDRNNISTNYIHKFPPDELTSLQHSLSIIHVTTFFHASRTELMARDLKEYNVFVDGIDDNWPRDDEASWEDIRDFIDATYNTALQHKKYFWCTTDLLRGVYDVQDDECPSRLLFEKTGTRCPLSIPTIEMTRVMRNTTEIISFIKAVAKLRMKEIFKSTTVLEELEAGHDIGGVSVVHHMPSKRMNFANEEESNSFVSHVVGMELDILLRGNPSFRPSDVAILCDNYKHTEHLETFIEEKCSIRTRNWRKRSMFQDDDDNSIVVDDLDGTYRIKEGFEVPCMIIIMRYACRIHRLKELYSYASLARTKLTLISCDSYNQYARHLNAVVELVTWEEKEGVFSSVDQTKKV